MTTRPTGGKSPASKTTSRKTSATRSTRSGTQRPAEKSGGAQGATKPAPARTSAGPNASRKTAANSGAGADSPILPVDQLEALGRIKPGAVDWVIEQTQAEAEHRRTELARVNNLIFVEHVFAQVSALIVAVAGIWAGVWLAMNGQPWVGFAIAAVVMIALAVIQLGARKNRA